MVNGRIFELLNQGFMYIAGRDRFFRPIVVVNAYMINSLDPQPTEDDLITVALFLINYVKTNMSVNGHVENALMIMNMNGQGVTSLPAGKIKTVLGALTSQHKCLTRSIFILSAPMAISILYKVVSIILDENLK